MLIELTGIPGSGKTTITRALVKWAQESDLPAFTTRDAIINYSLETLKIRWALRFLPENICQKIAFKFFNSLKAKQHYNYAKKNWPKTIQSLEEQLRRLKSYSPQDHQIMAGRIKYGIAHYIHFNRNILKKTLVFYDEGLIHRILYMFVTSRGIVGEKYLHEFIKGWPFPDGLLFINTHREKALQRIQYRQYLGPRLRNSTPAGLSLYMQNSQMILNYAYQESKNRHIPTLRVENNFDSLEIFFSSDQWQNIQAFLKNIINK